MRLLGIDCGCENRREIMFRAGKLGLAEGAILAVSAAMLMWGWRVKP